MVVEIAGKKYELNFGLGFIAELDKIYTVEESGLEFGVGMDMLIAYVKMRNPVALKNIIKAGTAHLNQKPSSADIEAYLEELASNDKLEDFFEELESNMKIAPFLKKRFQMVEEKIEN